MNPGPRTHLRIARPSRDLDRARRFWVDGLGASVLWSTVGSAPDDHSLLMIGFADAAWHLELVHDPELAAATQPTEEDLLVLYLDAPVPRELVARLVAAGGTRVVARNPYWERWGVTIADPDSYRLVLSSRSWP